MLLDRLRGVEGPIVVIVGEGLAIDIPHPGDIRLAVRQVSAVDGRGELRLLTASLKVLLTLDLHQRLAGALAYPHSGLRVVISSAYLLSASSTKPSAYSLPSKRPSVGLRQTMQDSCSITTSASSGKL